MLWLFYLSSLFRLTCSADQAATFVKRLYVLRKYKPTLYDCCHLAVVNLFPDRDDNVGVFDRKLFNSMINSAVFINLGRGRQVNEPDLIQIMKDRPDLTALLDVQHPEPPLEGSELYTLENIQLSGHIAGSKGTEFRRMADYMIDDFKRWRSNEPTLYEVDMEVAASMA